MIIFLKRNLTSIIIILNVCLIFIIQFLNPYHFHDYSEELLLELPEGIIYTFYSYFFEIIELPFIQGIFLSLFWMLLIYLITIFMYGLSKLTKVKVEFLKVTEVMVVSFSINIFKGLIEICYFMINRQVINQVFFDCAFALACMFVFCFIVRSYVKADKTNKIIYYSLIIFGAIIINSFYVVLNGI